MPRGAHTVIQLQPRFRERFSCKLAVMSVPPRPLSRLIRSAPVQVCAASVVLAGAGLYALDALLAAALRDTFQELPTPPQAATPLVPHDVQTQHQVVQVWPLSDVCLTSGQDLKLLSCSDALHNACSLPRGRQQSWKLPHLDLQCSHCSGSTHQQVQGHLPLQRYMSHQQGCFTALLQEEHAAARQAVGSCRRQCCVAAAALSLCVYTSCSLYVSEHYVQASDGAIWQLFRTVHVQLLSCFLCVFTHKSHCMQA